MKKSLEYPKNANKLLIFTLISIFICTSVFSQWKSVKSGTTQYMYDVQFINDTIGIAVGWNSTILKTINGGETWSPQAVGAGQRLYGVTFKDSLNGYAVGRSETSITGRYLYTIDGGANWIQKRIFPAPNTELPWQSISFSSNYLRLGLDLFPYLQKNGIIVGQGGQIAVSQDGGQTWNKRVSPTGDAYTINDVTFYDEKKAIAVGWGGAGGVIIKTTDGGNSWRTIKLNIGTGLYSVSFADKLRGITVGQNGEIYKTADGGENWVPLVSPIQSRIFYGVHYKGSRIYAVGWDGVIITSDNDGLNWTEEESISKNTLRTVFNQSTKATVAVGVSGTLLKKTLPPLKVYNVNKNEEKIKELDIEGLSIAADGSSSTRFEYAGQDKQNISLLFEEQVPPSNSDESGGFQPKKEIGDAITFVYNHPTCFAGSRENRQFKFLTLQVKNDSTGEILFTYSIKIVRPSVLMVHGIWSDGKDGFGEMEAKLLTEKMYKPYQLLKFDYVPDQLNFQSIDEYVKRKDTLKRKALDNNISLEKIDVLGHSNGGLLSRYYIQDTKKYEKDINKLITFNTPHSGSQMANIIRSPNYDFIGFLLFKFGYDSTQGIIDDLKIDGSFIKNLNTPSNYLNKYRDIGVHTITSTATASDIVGNIAGEGWDFLLSRYIQYNFAKYTLDFTLTNLIFYSPLHDIIVAKESQNGGVQTTSAFSNQIHMGSTKNDSIQEKTIILLNQKPKDAMYFSNEFNPTSLKLPNLPGISNKNTNQKQSTETITLISPIEGTSYIAGQDVSIEVNGSTGIKNIVTSMGNSKISIQNHIAENASTTKFKFTIPINALGRLEIVSAGFGSNGYENMASTFINVTTTAVLESLSVEEDLIFVAEGQKSLITILGHYNDGVTRNITKVGGLSYAFLKNNAKIVESGFVTGILEGEDLLLISYLGETTTAQITVVKSSNLSHKEIEQLTGISVYPNPTKGILNLNGDLTKLKSVTIFSLAGQRIMEIKRDFDAINIEALQSGIYMLKINTTDTSVTIKIIKE